MNKYKLINIETGKVIKNDVYLTSKEKSSINYAYALNGSALRYQ